MAELIYERGVDIQVGELIDYRLHHRLRLSETFSFPKKCFSSYINCTIVAISEKTNVFTKRNLLCNFNLKHFSTKCTEIVHLCISDGDGDEVVGSLESSLFFLLPLCVLLTLHASSTVSFSLPLLLVRFWRWNWREEQVSWIKLFKAL